MDKTFDVIHYICPACNQDLETACNLNKHLIICSKYDSWLKTYVPPYKKIEEKTKT
jgi:hypothetical protein